MNQLSEVVRYFICKSKTVKRDGIRYRVITVACICDTKREAFEYLKRLPKSQRIGVLKGTRGQHYPRDIVPPIIFYKGEVKC